MPEPDRTIAQRELRNDVSAVLDEVARGGRVRITVHGRPVADLVPIPHRSRWVSKRRIERLIRDHPLDPAFTKDIAGLLDETIDEL